MFIVYVVRLQSEPLARGTVTGIVEQVDSGERLAFHDVEELTDLLLATGGAQQREREIVQEHLLSTQDIPVTHAGTGTDPVRPLGHDGPPD